jgi:hypothetical protein
MYLTRSSIGHVIFEQAGKLSPSDAHNIDEQNNKKTKGKFLISLWNCMMKRTISSCVIT